MLPRLPPNLRQRAPIRQFQPGALFEFGQPTPDEPRGRSPWSAGAGRLACANGCDGLDSPSALTKSPHSSTSCLFAAEDLERPETTVPTARTPSSTNA